MSIDQRQINHHQGAPSGDLPGASARLGTITSDGPIGADGTTAIRISEVSKVFGHGRDAVHALDRVSLDVALSEFVCLIGASGCGKSTLLSLVAGLDAPMRQTNSPSAASSDTRSRACTASRPWPKTLDSSLILMAVVPSAPITSPPLEAPERADAPGSVPGGAAWRWSTLIRSPAVARPP